MSRLYLVGHLQAKTQSALVETQLFDELGDLIRVFTDKHVGWDALEHFVDDANITPLLLLSWGNLQSCCSDHVSPPS